MTSGSPQRRWVTLRLDLRFLAGTVVLFAVLVAIASYLDDGFIRTVGGDVLVVVFMYLAVRTVVVVDDTKLVVALVAFSFLVELGQYFRLVEVLGLEQHRLARIVIGTTFAWVDLLAYTLGGAAVLACLWLRGSLAPDESDD